MKAILFRRYGKPEGMYLGDIDEPIPAEDEVLVRVHAASVTIGDVIMRKLPWPVWWIFQLMGMPRKQVPGHEFSGVVESVGSRVTGYQPGDRVFGTTTGRVLGANAEYVTVPVEWKQGMLAKMPPSASFEQAAATPIGAMTALQILRQAELQASQKVLIYGASGSVGSFAVQVAKIFGAEVTAVCSAGNHGWVKALGADRVLDYRESQFAQQAGPQDVVFAAVNKLSAADRKQMLKPGGRYLSSMTSTSEDNTDLEWIAGRMEAGQFTTHIDRTFPLAEVPQAHAYVEGGHKRGNVVIQVMP